METWTPHLAQIRQKTKAWLFHPGKYEFSEHRGSYWPPRKASKMKDVHLVAAPEGAEMLPPLREVPGAMTMGGRDAVIKRRRWDPGRAGT